MLIKLKKKKEKEKVWREELKESRKLCVIGLRDLRAKC